MIYYNTSPPSVGTWKSLAKTNTIRVVEIHLMNFGFKKRNNNNNNIYKQNYMNLNQFKLNINFMCV